MKKLTEKQKNDLERRIKQLLLAGLDYCENTGKGTNYWFAGNNPYCAEAFGVMQALEVLNFGYFGTDNVFHEHNLKYWFEQLKEEVRQMGQEFGPKQAYYKFVGYEK